MKYRYIDADCIEAIRIITHNGMRISNPTDELLDGLGIGHPYVVTQTPAVTDGEALPEHAYVLTDGVIRDVWTIPQN